MSTDTQDQNTEQSAPPVAPSLSLNDLAAMQKIIEITSSRGAFKPDEMQVVGTVYQRLCAFLAATGAPAAEPENKEGTPQ